MQLTGHNYLKTLGVELIPATAPDFFTEDTPTAVLVRQVLGAVAEFEKTSLVSKLKAARERKKAETGKCGGRKSHAERTPEVVALASNCVVFGRSRRCETLRPSSRAVGTSTSAVTRSRRRRLLRWWRHCRDDTQDVVSPVGAVAAALSLRTWPSTTPNRVS